MKEESFNEVENTTPVQPEINTEPVAPTAPVEPVAPVAPVEPTAPAEPVAPVQPAAPSEPIMPVEPSATTQIPVQPVKTELEPLSDSEPKKKKSCLPVILIVFFLLIIAGCLVYYFLLKDKVEIPFLGSTTTTAATTTTTTTAATLTEEEANAKALEVLKKYYYNSLYEFETWCGGDVVDLETAIDLDEEKKAYKVKDYTTLEDLKKNMATFMSDSLIEKQVAKFTEKEEVLYCYVPASSFAFVNADSLEVYDITVTADTITAKAKYTTGGDEMFELATKNIEASIKKVNDAWIIDTIK